MPCCCNIQEYAPYQYTSAQIKSARDSIKDRNRGLCCRVAAAAFHALAALVCCLIDTLLTAYQWVFTRICPTRTPQMQNIDPVRRLSIPQAIPQPLQPEEVAPLNLTRVNPAPIAQPALSSQRALPPMRSSHSLQTLDPDSGIGTPTWFRSTNEAGQDEYSLCRLPPFRFHKTPDIELRNGRLHEKSGEFTLSGGGRILYTGDIGLDGQLVIKDNYPAIQFECQALNNLLKSPDLLHSIPEQQLHCSEPAIINLGPDLRKDYAIDAQAKSYRFIYPAQLDPDKAAEFAKRLTADRNVPAFIKGLLLIGGYAYYSESGALLQVKSFSASGEATEVLPTGKALDLDTIGFPHPLLQKFNLGVEMTSAAKNTPWEGMKNLISPYANPITAPTLKHLSHFAYIPQSCYASYGRMMEAAPLGGFLYLTKLGKYQFIPIGSDFIPAQVPPPPLIADLTEEQIQQNDKMRLFANMFFIPGSPNASMRGIEEFIESGMLQRHSDSINLTIQGGPGACYIIRATNGRGITICKKTGNIRQGEATAQIDPHGAIIPDTQLFRQLINEVYPYLMKKMIKVEWGAGGRLSTLRESIAFAPLDHLQTLVGILNSHSDFSINYLDLNERQYIAIDASGVGRDYLSELILSVLRDPDLFEADEHGLFLLKEGSSVSEKNQKVLQNIGHLFAWVLKKDGKYPTGRGLASSFFQYLHCCLTLTEQQVSVMNPSKLLDLYAMDNQSKTQLIHWLKQDTPPQTDRDFQHLKQRLIYDIEVDGLSDDEGINQKIQREWGSIKSKAQNILIQRVKEKVLPSYRIIARALRQKLTSSIPLSGIELDLQIQGQTDRNGVADAITYTGSNPSIQRKVRWIQQWIRGVASLKEVEDFVKAATGSRALGLGRRISINEMAVTQAHYFPIYHTCFSTIDMPFGHSLDREGHRDQNTFLNAFKTGLIQALAAPNGFSMS